MGNCQTCTDGQACLSCQSPYYLRLDGTCQSDCSSSQQDKDGNYKCELCIRVLPNCLQCHLAGTICTKCDTGYFLSANTCFLCSSYINDCATCSDQLTCTKCSTNYLDSGQCVEECSKNYYQDAQNICQFCNKKLSQNDCIDECSEYEQDIDKDNICKLCSLEIQ